MSQPSVSRIVSELETQLGVALLTRTTRAVTLTEAGQDYLIRTDAILTAVAEADHAARGGAELRGLLRLGMSTSFAMRTVLPVLAKFTEAHPGLRVEFVLADQRQNLITESVDLAVRIGPLTDSSGAVAHRLGATSRILVASPDYLLKAGAPAAPEQLSHHALIAGPAGHAGDMWVFRRAGVTQTLRVEPRFVLNGNEAAVAAAAAGLGIVATGRLGCRAELHNGRLATVLDGWDLGHGEVHLILPAGRAAKPSARAFAAFMRTGFADGLFESML